MCQTVNSKEKIGQEHASWYRFCRKGVLEHFNTETETEGSRTHKTQTISVLPLHQSVLFSVIPFPIDLSAHLTPFLSQPLSLVMSELSILYLYSNNQWLRQAPALSCTVLLSYRHKKYLKATFSFAIRSLKPHSEVI